MRFWQDAKTHLRQAFKTDESRFVLSTAVKFCALSCGVMLMVGHQIYQIVRLNLVFFRANGFSGIDELSEAYYDALLGNVAESLPLAFACFVVLFFVGLYLGIVILRPFKNIEDYCARAMEDPDAAYHVDQFAGYRLMTRFSELFFEFLRQARRQGKMEALGVPPQYTGIHRPLLDWPFLLHFSFFVLIMALLTVGMTMFLAMEVHENTVQLAIRMLKTDPKMMAGFFSAQTFVIEEMWILTGVLVMGTQMMLALHLYNQVSGAAFAIFSTMRTFMKGNHFARVHLVGYSYLRDSTRTLNKYLDWTQKNLSGGPGQG